MEIPSYKNAFSPFALFLHSLCSKAVCAAMDISVMHEGAVVDGSARD